MLSIVAEDTAGMMVIESGRITHVRINEIEGPDALLQILDLKSGSINALSCAAPQRETLSVSAERLEAAMRSKHRLERLRLLNGDTLNDELEEEGEKSSEVWLADGLVENKDYQSQIAEELSEEKDESSEEASSSSGSLPLRVSTSEEGEDKDESASEEDEDIDLTLTPEEDYLPEVEKQSLSNSSSQKPRLRKKDLVKMHLQEGVEHFKSQRLEEARRAWLKVLSLDSNCSEAKRNLAILEQVVSSLAKAES